MACWPCQAVVAHDFSPSTWEAEPGGSLEFEASQVYRELQGYTEKPCLEIQKNEKPKQKSNLNLPLVLPGTRKDRRGNRGEAREEMEN